MKILLIEDNEKLSKNIAEFLKLDKNNVDVALDGENGYYLASIGKYDLVILDLDLPGKSGQDICYDLRENNISVPILILTAQNTIADRIKGLDLGADDYLGKPFALEELSARVRALSRRKSDTPRSDLIKIANIMIDNKTKTVTKNKTVIDLSPKEYAILKYLASHHGVPKNQLDILDAVWGTGGDDLVFGSETVEVHISYLRKKIGHDIIKTKRGHGYYIP